MAIIRENRWRIWVLEHETPLHYFALKSSLNINISQLAPPPPPLPPLHTKLKPTMIPKCLSNSFIAMSHTITMTLSFYISVRTSAFRSTFLQMMARLHQKAARIL